MIPALVLSAVAFSSRQPWQDHDVPCYGQDILLMNLGLKFGCSSLDLLTVCISCQMAAKRCVGKSKQKIKLHSESRQRLTPAQRASRLTEEQFFPCRSLSCLFMFPSRRVQFLFSHFRFSPVCLQLAFRFSVHFMSSAAVRSVVFFYNRSDLSHQVRSVFTPFFLFFGSSFLSFAQNLCAKKAAVLVTRSYHSCIFRVLSRLPLLLRHGAWAHWLVCFVGS